jgi:starch synthase
MTERSASRANVLYAASEMTPLIKTGGLADVAASLPRALHAAGCDVRVVLPHYGALKAVAASHPIARTRILDRDVAVNETTTPDGQRVWLVACPELFDRPGNPYTQPDGTDWPDNAERFALFARTIAWLSTAADTGFKPTIVHLNDWQTGLAAALLKGHPGAPPTVFTIHNLAFQGIFDHAAFLRLQLPAHLWSVEILEYFGAMSFIKAGIACADCITTVSPTYACEIQTEAYGCGLDGLLRHRATALHGILNGIDTAVWNPATDPLLPARYTVTSIARKQTSKRALQTRLGLAAQDAPLLGVVSRLTPQKGIDLILTVLDAIVALPAQIAVLGRGEAGIEAALHAASERHPGRVAYVARYDEAMAHLIEAGADIFLMPSRFEPCGLNQMYSLAYGTIPVVRRTGGLADTVTPAEQDAGNGFVFDEATPEALLHAIRSAVTAYHDPRTWQTLQRNAMTCNFSGQRSAEAYLHIYRALRATPAP